MKLVLRILVFATTIFRAYAFCNACSAVTGLACVSNTQFRVCINGLQSTNSLAMECPTGTLCTPGPDICSPQETAAPQCDRCNTCDTNNAFACTGFRTFALCLGTTTPGNVSYTCPGTTVCYIDSPEICVDPATTGLGGTCPSVTTAPDPATHPQEYCQSVESPGRYEITTDPNCKQFVLCSLVNSTWVGHLYECPGPTRFNATSRLCGAGIPPRCAYSYP